MGVGGWGRGGGVEEEGRRGGGEEAGPLHCRD